MADKTDMEHTLTRLQVQDWISKGKSRKYCVDKLVETGMKNGAASMLYYRALKDMLPEPNLLDDYKKNLIQQNLDRLENVIETSLSGNTADKAIALKAIDTLNKMCGAYSDNNITIAQQNKDGDQQIIQITFDK